MQGMAGIQKFKRFLPSSLRCHRQDKIYTKITIYEIEGESCIKKTREDKTGIMIKGKLLGRGGLYLMLCFIWKNKYPERA